jgi:hypothetical protein
MINNVPNMLVQLPVPSNKTLLLIPLLLLLKSHLSSMSQIVKLLLVDSTTNHLPLSLSTKLHQLSTLSVVKPLVQLVHAVSLLLLVESHPWFTLILSVIVSFLLLK